jgi:hypothetical protein
MERTQQTEGERAMYRRSLRKRILKGLVISLALLAVIPVSNAAAKPVSVGQPDPWFQTLVANRAYQKSQFGVSGQELNAMIARGEGLNKKYNLGQYAFRPTESELAAMTARGDGLNKKYNLGQYAFRPTESELAAMTARGDGLNRKYHLGQYAVPTEPQAPVASTGSDFEWSNAGIGVGIVAVLIAGTAAALVVRSRHTGGLAH